MGALLIKMKAKSHKLLKELAEELGVPFIHISDERFLKDLCRNKMTRLYSVISFANKRFPAGTKNTVIAALRRVFSTQLGGEITSRNGQVISAQILS